ncbi:MAG: hypothetical protein ABR581_04195 [Thermoleophilaceae bacterium]
MIARTKPMLVACTVLAALTFPACGQEKEPGAKSPAREGLDIPLAGIDYNVFITRELNLKVQPDSAYYKGPEPGKGQTLYGIFLQACNHGKQALRTAGQFTVLDSQGNSFAPTPLPRDNAFAYQARMLAPDQCVPPAGSVAQLGPTAGAMLLFRLPLTITENRPLELEIATGAPGEKRRVELDL